MKLLRSSLAIVLAAILGFIAGAWSFHTPRVEAQTRFVTITPVSVGTNSAANAPAGTNVVGFSCVPSDPNRGGSSICYVATR